MTHPVQYYAPWFRYITSTCPAIDLTVVYAIEPKAEQQGVGFGASFEWDVPLRDGYVSRVAHTATGRESVHSDSFFGLDVPELVPSVLATAPDVVLVPGWHSISLIRVLRACRREGIPALYRGDSNLRSAPIGWRRPIWAVKTKYLLRHFSAYLSVGMNASAYLRAFGVAPERIFSSPHCVDNDFFAESASPWQVPDVRAEARQALGIAPNAFVALFVGKLESKKRVQDAIIAMADRQGECCLVIVGEGPERRSLSELADANGVPVVWLGFLNQSELGRAYALADCLVLPSDGRETWGLVVNEALAAGLPCVLSDRVGAAPDLAVSNVSGEQFAFGSPSSLGAALDRVRDAVQLGRITADTCRAHVQQYSFVQATEGLIRAAEHAIATSLS
jgi:glycosyltransferase involved in cell wall biosynthesis